MSDYWAIAEQQILTIEELLSGYEFGRRLVVVRGLDESCLLPCRQVDVQMAAPRPPDLSMESGLA